MANVGAGWTELLARIDAHLGWPKADRRGERWVPCPFHGERKHNSFSYSERGFKCFGCPAKGGLRQFAAHLGIVADSEPLPLVVRQPKPKPKPSYRGFWRDDPDYWRRFQPLSDRAYRYARSRGLSDESLERWRFGSGALPLCRCGYERLILPVFVGRRLVGLRGRLLPDAAQLRPCLPDPKGEHCQHEKWLQSGGGEVVLFGGDQLHRHPGATVIVTEAPLSCVLAMQARPELVAVASTAGCGTWWPEWTELLVRARPAAVVVWMDHDKAGEAAGLKVAAELARAHLPVHRYRWGPGWPEKADLADVVTASSLSGVVA